MACHAWTRIRVLEFKSNNLCGGLIWPTKREGLTQKGKGKGTTTNVGACSPYVCHISSFNLLSQLAKKTLKVKMQTPAHKWPTMMMRVFLNLGYPHGNDSLRFRSSKH